MDEIMRKYANDVKRFCMSLCHDEQMAEELTQETFYRALKTIHHYNGSCAMTSWLFLISKRAWIDMLRKKKPIVPIEQSSEPVLRSIETPEELFRRKMQKEYLESIIDELEEPEHSVFLMRALLEKSFKEIGKEYNKSENWARVTYYRVRMKLVERVKRDEDAL